MEKRKRHYDLSRIVKNAKILSIPEACESFLYGASPEDIEEIEGEIEEVASMIPNGVSILDLPDTICGNTSTKVFGKASCAATDGHLILAGNVERRRNFKNCEEAINMGFRPCAKCMRKEYEIWKIAAT